MFRSFGSGRRSRLVGGDSLSEGAVKSIGGDFAERRLSGQSICGRLLDKSAALVKIRRLWRLAGCWNIYCHL
jgi:hypothetical protein